MDTCRVLIDPEPMPGSWNMAVDETLLESAIERQTCTLRLYRWSEATLSLGYFQPEDAARRDPRLASLPAVRRLSGGGAILHHHEITYSCTIPPNHPLAADPLQLYDRVHEQIVGILKDCGIPAVLRGQAIRSPDEPFLCFGRGDPRDIVLDGHKILGSAQRRRRGAVLQHGSLLLSRSPYAPEFPGIAELAPHAILPDRLTAELAARVVHLLAPSQAPSILSPAERDRVRSLQLDRYSTLSRGARAADAALNTNDRA